MDKHTDVEKEFEDLGSLVTVQESETFTDLVPSIEVEKQSGVIKSVNSKLQIGYPLIKVKIHEEDNVPLRKVESIKHVLDTTTNDHETLEAEKRIRVLIQFTQKDGHVNEGLIGTLRPISLMQLMSVLELFEVEGYLSEDKRIEKKHLYALSVIK